MKTTALSAGSAGEIQEGCLVRLFSYPYGAPGKVVKRVRGRFLVFWPGVNFLGKHDPESLRLAGRRMPK